MREKRFGRRNRLQSSVEVTEHFYSDLNHAMVNADKLTMVMGDFSASLVESAQGVVGPHGLGRHPTMGRDL